jgi:NAD(P)-dependent dehydrogenase (short-subunit alcohol dehydrogenase family)
MRARAQIKGVRAQAFKADQAGKGRDLVKKIAQQFGRLDILVNAGVFARRRGTANNRAGVERQFAVNAAAAP